MTTKDDTIMILKMQQSLANNCFAKARDTLLATQQNEANMDVNLLRMCIGGAIDYLDIYLDTFTDTYRHPDTPTPEPTNANGTP